MHIAFQMNPDVKFQVIKILSETIALPIERITETSKFADLAVEKTDKEAFIDELGNKFRMTIRPMDAIGFTSLPKVFEFLHLSGVGHFSQAG